MEIKLYLSDSPKAGVDHKTCFNACGFEDHGLGITILGMSVVYKGVESRIDSEAPYRTLEYTFIHLNLNRQGCNYKANNTVK